MLGLASAIGRRCNHCIDSVRSHIINCLERCLDPKASAFYAQLVLRGYDPNALVDVLPVQHALVALALALAVPPGRLGSATVATVAFALAGFALATFLLSASNAHWMTKATGAAFLGYAFAYGGLSQFAAGMWEFRNRNVFGATAFGSYGTFWIGLGLYFVLVVPAPAGAGPLVAALPGAGGGHRVLGPLAVDRAGAAPRRRRTPGRNAVAAR